jgi:HD-GYP domain-containing protein (c-di-GMP phosphodiesterase class II)
MVTAIAARLAREPRVKALLDGLSRHSQDVLAHGLDVAVLSIRMGNALGLDDLRMMRLIRAALLHDIGKQHVPVEILQKPGPLNAREWEIVERHPMTGHHMLVDAGMVAEARIVLHHHERVDGGGYPTGRAGEDIPLESRILAVADSFDAMTSERPYRRAMSVDAAIAELRAQSGRQFDRECVEALAASYMRLAA